MPPQEILLRGHLTYLLFQEAVDDLFLGLLFGQTQSHQLDQLLTGNLANGGFVDQAGVHAVGGQLGACQDTGAMMMASHSLWPAQAQLPLMRLMNS